MKMKYTIFFNSLFLFCIYSYFHSSSSFKFLFLWPSVNCLLFGIAYATNNSWFQCGKDYKGRINPILMVLNFPWLVSTWTILILQRFISSEARVNRIDGTNWYISSYPGISYKNEFYDYLIDLTSEFPRPWNDNEKYHCFPNLDGIALSHLPKGIKFRIESKVLVYCAQGHGRSATWAAIAMTKAELFCSTETAYGSIKKSRPAAIVSREQKNQLAKA